MTLRSYANKRDASEKSIVQALEDAGCSVVRMDKPVDLLIGFRGVTHLAECKTPGTQYGKKINHNQEKFSQSWLGSSVIVLRTIDDVVSVISKMTKAA